LKKYSRRLDILTKKTLVFYPGCIMQTEQYSYEISLREILPVLDIKLVDVEGFSCCGEPLKSVNRMITLVLSARNIALAESRNLDIFTPCPICNLAFRECKNILDNDDKIKEKVNGFLAEEGLTYNGISKVIDLLELLYDIVGLDYIKKHVKKPLDLKAAVHYGCHAIRPSEIGRSDDSEEPRKIEDILEVLGVEAPWYPEKLDCCGGLLNMNLPETALTKTGEKLRSIQEQGFDLLVDICPWCHRQFDSKQKKSGETVAYSLNLPVVYLTQLMGLAFDIPWGKLGFNLNLSPVNTLVEGR